MRTITPLFAFVFLLGAICSSLLAQEPMPDSVQQTKSFQRTITKKVGAEYLLFLPRDYKPRGSQKWPLILFLHGSGERGTKVWQVAQHGPPKIVRAKPDFPFIVVSPQCPAGEVWSSDVLLPLLDEITSIYKVDTSRIYLTGSSMGGYGTWRLGLTHPERFAAIAPICGGGDPINIELADRKKLNQIKKLPVWAFHGAKDPAVKLEESEKMVNALKRVGNDAKLTVYPEATHDSWTETYNNPELYEWFLKHRRER